MFLAWLPKINIIQYFFKTTLVVLSGWHNVTHCLVSSCLVLSYMAQHKPLPYMLINVSNTVCNLLCTTLLGNIIHVQSVKWKFILVEKLWYVKNHQKRRRGKTRQDQADKTKRGNAKTKGILWFLKNNVVHVFLWFCTSPIYRYPLGLFQWYLAYHTISSAPVK